MAYTQEQIDAAKAAAARGAVEYQFNGERVRYESLAALRRQIRVMEDEIAGSNAGRMTVGYVHRPGRGR